MLDLSRKDWEARLRAGRSLLPDLEPVNPELAARAVRCFDRLRIPDVPGTPAMAEACGDWFREIVSALFGALDPETGMRAIQELFLLVPKKNSKTTNGAGLMLTAVIVNERPNAEFLIVAPTKEIADLAFSQALGMVQNDRTLMQRFHAQTHLKRLTFRTTGATLQVKAFSPDVMTGLEPAGVLVDEKHVIAMRNDAGSIEALYEGGASGGIVFAGEVADVFTVEPPPGHYIVQSDSSGVWFRLGTRPVWAITLDATGALPDGTTPGGLLSLLRGMLLQDCQLEPDLFDASWQAPGLDWPGGWYWDGSARVTGRDIADTLLAGLGIRLVASRTGTLRPVAVHAPHAGAVAHFGPHNLIAVAPVALDDMLDPPPARWRVGYAHAQTVQAAGSGLSPLVTPERQAFIGQADRLASWASPELRRRYRVPNDPPPLVTALSDERDAVTVATLHAALWASTRRLRALIVPMEQGYAVNLGDHVTLILPEHPDRTLSGLVVGEQLRPGEATITLQVLVGDQG